MAKRPRVLLVLFEGLADTVVDSQVLDHARQLTAAGIAEFEIWAFACSGALVRKSRDKQAAAREMAASDVCVFRGVRPAVPFSTWLNGLLFGLHLLRRRPAFDALHARTDFSTAVCGATGARNWPLIWDCRGDAVAEIAAQAASARGAKRWLAKARERRAAATRRRAASACDRALFVSRPLRALCAPLLRDKPAAVVPCAAAENRFFFDPALRAQMRERLGYGDDARVYVYSGSLAPYQCFDETVALFAALSAADDRARLLVLCPAADEATRRVSTLDPARVHVTAVPLSQVNDHLNAADVALMLREPTGVNRVASPTKFAEYCLAGLTVAMTDAVPDAVDAARTLGNLALVNGTRIAWPPPPDRAGVAAAARALLGKQHLLPRYADIYGTA